MCMVRHQDDADTATSIQPHSKHTKDVNLAIPGSLESVTADVNRQGDIDNS